MDVNGVIRLSNVLAVVKQKLLDFVIPNHNSCEDVNLRMPDHMGCIVTTWHFGADALAVYAGEKYYRRWEVADKILVTIYTKEWKDHKKG